MLKIKNIIKIMWELMFVLFCLIVLSSVVYRIYESFKVINNIKEPSKCIEINDEYYCKVEKVKE